MGKKADALQEDLEITIAELRAEQALNKDLRIENGLLRDVVVKCASVAALAELDQALLTRAPRAAADNPTNTSASLVRSSGRTTVSFGEGDLGIQPDSSLAGGTDDAQEAIRQLHNAPLPVEREETTLEVVQRNNWERQQLNESQRKSNALINRIASALGVSRWDEDGAEILERAQRFSVFHHWLARRLKETIQQSAGDGEVAYYNSIRIAELRTIISALVAPAQLSKFLHEKLQPTATAPPSIFDVATDAAAADFKGTATRADVLQLRDAAAVWASERGQPVPAWLAATAKSDEATNVLLELLNLVLKPTLVRMKLVGI